MGISYKRNADLPDIFEHRAKPRIKNFVEGKFCVVKQHSDGSLHQHNTKYNTIKEAIHILYDVRKELYASNDKYHDYKCYDFVDYWICVVDNCAHRFMHNGSSCEELLAKTTVIKTANCKYHKCGKVFQIVGLRRVFCSVSCAKKSRAEDYYKRHFVDKTGTQIFTRDCKHCHTQFSTKYPRSQFHSRVCKIEYRNTERRTAHEKTEDTIKVLMLQLFEQHNHKAVLSSDILLAMSASHGVKSIRSNLAEGTLKKKWQRLGPGLYMPLNENGEKIADPIIEPKKERRRSSQPPRNSKCEENKELIADINKVLRRLYARTNQPVKCWDIRQSLSQYRGGTVSAYLATRAEKAEKKTWIRVGKGKYQPIQEMTVGQNNNETNIELKEAS